MARRWHAQCAEVRLRQKVQRECRAGLVACSRGLIAVYVTTIPYSLREMLAVIRPGDTIHCVWTTAGTQRNSANIDSRRRVNTKRSC
eukprot:COSAG06_NODE_23613_length_686_cov_1.284497_1_plen_86_part_10